MAQLGLQLAGQQNSSTAAAAAPTQAISGSTQPEQNTGLGGLQRLISGTGTSPTTAAAQNVHALAGALTQGGQPGPLGAHTATSQAQQPPPSTVAQDPDFLRLQTEVRQLRGTSDETVTRLTAVERTQQQQSQTLSKIDTTMAAIASKLGIGGGSSKAARRGKSAAGSEDMHSCFSDAPVVGGNLATAPSGQKLVSLRVTKEKHENFLAALEITDSAFEALICCPEWDTEPELEMPGDEWWEFTQDACPTLASWRQRVMASVPRHQKASKARSKATFIRGLLDEALDADLNPIM